jgi:transcriptional regulator with XRE-family HTH domain
MAQREEHRSLAEKIGRHARQARQRVGLTQAEVAERVDLAVEVYGRIERGRMMPSLGTLARLAAALRVLPSDLLSDVIVAREGGAQPLPSREIRRVVRLMEGLSVQDQGRVYGIVAAAVRMGRRVTRARG